jgi:hypothetical protein
MNKFLAPLKMLPLIQNKFWLNRIFFGCSPSEFLLVENFDRETAKKMNTSRIGVMVAHKPSKLATYLQYVRAGSIPVFCSKHARSVTAAQRLSVPYWGFQPLSSSSILDGRANFY